jgi:type VI secretion system secreted protein Hcp
MAQVDYFLVFDGIKGGSEDDKHKGEIELLSFDLTMEQESVGSSGTGSGAGKAKFWDFSWSAHVDVAYPPLMGSLATGKHIKSAVFTARQAGGSQQEYFTIKFTDVLITELEVHGGEKGAKGAAPSKPTSPISALLDSADPHHKPIVIPVVRGKLNFTEIDVDFKGQKADGSLGGAVKAGHSLNKNKPK